MIDAEPPTAPAPAPSTNRRFIIILSIMALAFLAVLLYRNRLRCEWWAHQLASATSVDDQSYYVSCLLACGDDALPAIRRLARDPKPETRSLALLLLGRRNIESVVDDIVPLLQDTDRDIRESAGMTLVFSASPAAIARLCDTAASPNEAVACAALASLGRTSDPRALACLCDALTRRPQPLVRAQAAEALAESLDPAPGAERPGGIPTSPCDPVATLVHALADTGVFTGVLATERQINQVAAHVATQSTQPVSMPSDLRRVRTVASVAAAGLSRVTGTTLPATPVTDEKAAAAQFRALIQGRR